MRRRWFASARATAALAGLGRDARLLVLGRSTRGALHTGLAGSPVRDLLHAPPCPVLVVPTGGRPYPALLPRRGRGWTLTSRPSRVTG